MVTRLSMCLLLVGCVEQIDARWQLDHDHVVAVRATPPAVMPYDRARIDALIAHAGAPTTIESPVAAVGPQVASDDPLYDLVAFIGDGWYVTSPSEAALAAVRARDGLTADAPVPLRVVMAFERDGDTATTDDLLYATKTVYLGARGENPGVPEMIVDGKAAVLDDDRLVVPMERDVYLSVAAGDARVNWLTSCGSLFQDDVATAFLRVLPDDRTEGELALVLRDETGGVAWRVWPVTATR